MSHFSKNYINNLSEKLKQNNKLENIIEEFIISMNLQPRIGVEIEFYLSKNIDVKQFEHLLGIEVVSESGENQFEIKLSPHIKLIKYIDQIESTKINIKEIASLLGGEAYLNAKPFLNDYGNSMQLNIDFIHYKEKLIKDFNINLAAESLCHYMKEYFLVFMPKEEDYLRIDPNFMCPTHICHGRNNRTVAVRIPDKLPKRLEHRVASPTCDIYLCIFAILKSILLGFKNPSTIEYYPIIYGNAFDPQYNLTMLPKNIDEAYESFNEKFFTL